MFYPRRPETNLHLVLTSHKRKLPRKCTFQLLFGSIMLIRLDVHPGRWHKNKKLGESVRQTHWHVWPDVEEVEPDARDLPHQHWFHHFLQRARTSFGGTYKPPPYEPSQLKLL